MPSHKPGSRLIRAAGAVAWRPGPDNEPEVLLVHRKKYDDWSLPKGKVEPGETLPVTAVREVMEEGGARLALGRRLSSVRYNVGGRPKRVHYWVARVLSVDDDAVPNHEVDEVTWLPADEAVRKVSYRRDHGVLDEFAAWPQETVPLILLRHAKALPKGGWKRADDARPLDDAGRSDAKSLADMLTCFAPRPRLISSTAIRCLETLLPLAELTGQPVHAAPSLYVHYTPADKAEPEAELAAVVREAIASGQPTIVCAHRENIPALRRAALALLAAPPADIPDATTDRDAHGGHGGRSAQGGHGGRGHGGRDAPASPSGPGLSPVADLPANWDSPLPPGGFWVLNVAPLSATSPSAPGAVPEPDEVALEPAEGRSEPAEGRSEPSAAAPGPAGAAAVPAAARLTPTASQQSPESPATRRRSRWWRLARSRSSSSAQEPAFARPSPPAAGGPAADGAARVPELVASAAAPGRPGKSAADGAPATRTAATAPAAGQPSAPAPGGPRGGKPADGTPADRTPADRTPADGAPAVADPGNARGPFGILVSADRYDLTD